MSFYIYVYRNPTTDQIFYVGKGKNDRAFSHLRRREKKLSLHNSDFAAKIDEILVLGIKPSIEILEYFDNEKEALTREIALIEEIGIGNLSNKICTPWPPIMPADVIEKRANTCKNNPAWRATITSQEHREKLSRSVRKAIQDRGGRPPLSAEHRKAVSQGCKGKLVGTKNPMSKNTPDQIFEYLLAVMKGEHWKEASKRLQISNAWNVVQRNAWKTVDPPEGYTPPPNRKTLNDEIIKEIIRLNESGMARKKISEMVGFSSTTVTNVLKKHG